MGALCCGKSSGGFGRRGGDGPDLPAVGQDRRIMVTNSLSLA
jgi:hypothetical protein